MASFAKLKAAGLPKTSAKLSRMASSGKLSFGSVPKVKIPKGKSFSKFNFAKYTKVAKLPKTAKVTALKKAVKKAKNVKF